MLLLSLLLTCASSPQAIKAIERVLLSNVLKVKKVKICLYDYTTHTIYQGIAACNKTKIKELSLEYCFFKLWSAADEDNGNNSCGRRLRGWLSCHIVTPVCTEAFTETSTDMADVILRGSVWASCGERGNEVSPHSGSAPPTPPSPTHTPLITIMNFFGCLDHFSVFISRGFMIPWLWAPLRYELTLIEHK